MLSPFASVFCDNFEFVTNVSLKCVFYKLLMFKEQALRLVDLKLDLTSCDHKVALNLQ